MELGSETEDVRLLNGKQYLFTSKALGLSLEAQEKLVELVDGKGARAAGVGGRRLRWRDMQNLASDLRDNRRYDNLVGPKIAE